LTDFFCFFYQTNALPCRCGSRIRYTEKCSVKGRAHVRNTLFVKEQINLFLEIFQNINKDVAKFTIKNNINYEQERDRTTIHEANVRSKSTIDNFAQVKEHAEGN
jgi:hypothetical protein